MSQNNVHHRKRVMRRQYHFNHVNNTTNDMAYPTNNDEQHRIAYVRKKPDGLICSICDGPAHGYNFDTITCESCKAFFRRNALRTDKNLKCRANDGKCVITITTRKRCKACRLAKCLAKGMRSDWILTDEERMHKKQKIEENRRLRQMLYPDSSESDESPSVKLITEPLQNNDTKFCSFFNRELLSSADLIKIEQIQKAYKDSVCLTSVPPEILSYPHRTPLDAPCELLNLPVNLQSTRLITYFKLMPEFSALNEHDKLILIKYNIFALAFIRSVLNYDPVTDNYQEYDTDECIFAGKDLIQCFSLHQYEQTTHCINRLFYAAQNDRILVQILLLIMLFSKGSSVCIYGDEGEPLAKDILSIYHAQNIFIDLLWKYCENKFGYVKAIQIWIKLVTGSIEAILQAYNTRSNYIQNNAVAEQLVPLMKSVMLIV